MKYITKVIIENFQSHKYTVIEFDRYLNVIVGPSDQGKSAIIRAIKWVLYNEPTGTFFIREGEKDCSVTLFFNDGTKLKRLRTPSKNLYIFYDIEGNETIYEGFGTNVPDEIVEKTNIRKTYLDNSQSITLNISDQLEGPFLLSEKTSTRANAIGRIVGVHIIDRAIADTLKDIRNLNINKKNIENNLEELENQLKEYDYLEQLKLIIEKLEDIQTNIVTKTERMKNINAIRLKYKDIQIQKQQVEEIIDKLKNINDLDSLFHNISEKAYKLSYLIKKKEQYCKITKDLEGNENIINQLEHIEKLDKKLIKIKSNLDLRQKLINLKQNYLSIVKVKEENDYIVNQFKDIKTVDNLVILLNNKCLTLQKLVNINDKLNEVNKRVSIGYTYVEAFKDIEKVDNSYEEINIKIEKLKVLDEIKNQYKDLNQNTLQLSNDLKLQDNIITNLLNEYGKLLEEMEMCPFCLNKIKADDIKRILKEME